MTMLPEIPHPVSDRIMIMRVPLTEDRNNRCICSNNGEPRREQGGILQSAKGCTQKHPSTDKLPLIGDFNARIGRENASGPQYVIGKCNSNSKLPLALRTAGCNKITWTHPGLGIGIW